MLYGADYNPDQWPEDVWDEDVRLMREAGVNIVSLGIFAWSRIQPTEDVWDFDWLDRVIEKLHAGGIQVNLATATASPPPWVSSRYPETLPADESGASYWPGSRQHFAPSSPTYRRLAGELVRRIAERYAQHPAVVMWHVGNEFGCHLPMDFSDAARDAYRAWLRERYATIDALNEAWGTNFWSQRYAAFGEIFPPRLAPYSHNPSSMLDFRRFTSDMLLECYLMERGILLEAGATQPITTNFMGPFKPADYSVWAQHMDVIADDCYPDPTNPHRVRDAAFQRDLVRSLKPGVPWLLWEQATDAVNWRPANPGKKPGALMAETAQSIARGADGIMFFQWRQSRSGSEKFHSAMLPHAGTRTRTWDAVTDLGARLAALPELPPPGRDARVALIFDWESWWAAEERDHPTEVDYLALSLEWYGALHKRGIMVDIVAPERVDDGYDLAIAPALYLLRDEGAASLVRFVEGGGTLLAGPFTDVVDEHDQFRSGGFLTQLGPVLGVRFEDFGALGGASTGGMGVGAQTARGGTRPVERSVRSATGRSRARSSPSPSTPRARRSSRHSPRDAAPGRPRSHGIAQASAKPGTSRRCPTPPGSMPSSRPWSRHPASARWWTTCRRESRLRAAATSSPSSTTAMNRSRSPSKGRMPNPARRSAAACSIRRACSSRCRPSRSLGHGRRRPGAHRSLSRRR